MTKYILTLIILCLTINVSAQDYIQRGNTFIEVDTTSTNKSSNIETPFIWIDKTNTEYVIFLSKNGRAFVKMFSKKTNKEYKKYLGEKISRAICKKLNRTYVENTAKL